MAAPVGHIICALAFLNGSSMTVADKNEFLVGTSFPDIRYLGGVSRKVTHAHEGRPENFRASSSNLFEAGRKFHVFIDQKREEFMRKNQAYKFLQDGPLKTQMLKLIEDHILFERLNNKIVPKNIFNKIYLDEISYGVSPEQIKNWHDILSNYLDSNYYFDWWRYLSTVKLLDKIKESDKIFHKLKTFSLLVYAYFKVQELSNNQELRNIILAFYDQELPKIISRARLE